MIRDGSPLADGDVILRSIDEDDLYADGRIKYRAFLVNEWQGQQWAFRNR